MGNLWTEEQKQVIWLRNRNILVSAAAGSGKTAVLVERILQKITDREHPVDIDRLLIVTFTRAAAAEMRERIGLEIQKKLLEDPDNENLQRQETLLFHASDHDDRQFLSVSASDIFSSDRFGSGIFHRG